jgi:hypothetical protein
MLWSQQWNRPRPYMKISIKSTLLKLFYVNYVHDQQCSIKPYIILDILSKSEETAIGEHKRRRNNLQRIDY